MVGKHDAVGGGRDTGRKAVEWHSVAATNTNEHAADQDWRIADAAGNGVERLVQLDGEATRLVHIPSIVVGPSHTRLLCQDRG